MVVIISVRLTDKKENIKLKKKSSFAAWVFILMISVFCLQPQRAVVCKRRGKLIARHTVIKKSEFPDRSFSLYPGCAERGLFSA